METDEQTLAGELGAERKRCCCGTTARPAECGVRLDGRHACGRQDQGRNAVFTARTAARSLCARRTARSILMRRPTARLRPGTGGLSRHGLYICRRGYERVYPETLLFEGENPDASGAEKRSARPVRRAERNGTRKPARGVRLFPPTRISTASRTTRCAYSWTTRAHCGSQRPG